jgi:hypothetical protein
MDLVPFIPLSKGGNDGAEVSVSFPRTFLVPVERCGIEELSHVQQKFSMNWKYRAERIRLSHTGSRKNYQ